MSRVSGFKKGAASFYIVAIATLILVIVAASFAAVIISEITRTSNDDLAQSAYDSALAGVEDAKLAYYNYQNCKENSGVVGGGLECNDIIEWVEEGTKPAGIKSSCDMVAAILGRGTGGEVPVQESSANNMQQAYTCVKFSPRTEDIKGRVDESNPVYTVRLKFDETETGTIADEDRVANKIAKVKVKWHSDTDGDERRYAKFGDKGLFEQTEPMPAVLSVGMVQTSTVFHLSDFDMTMGDRTDRGTVYLVPTNNASLAAGDNYELALTKHIDANGFLKSNDKTSINKPYAVYCEDDSGYACSVTIDIPRPVGSGVRNKDTFVFKIALPYGKPSTDFSLEFYCNDGTNCYTAPVSTAVDESLVVEPVAPVTPTPVVESPKAVLDGVQVRIDSTGRANDLYRRVETRLVPADTTTPYPLYAIQLLGSGSGSLIEKDLSPTCEGNFGVPNC